MTESVATRYAGTRVPRVEDNRLLTGRGTFVDDVSRPGMLHACFVRSPFARAMDICGRRDFGITTTPTVITGCPERGCSHPNLDICGRRAGGDGAGARFSGTPGIGDRTLVSTAESIMDLDILGMGLRAGGGRTIISSTTPRSCT